MAGTIPLSLTQQFDEFGKPLSGGLLYIIQAGTVATPQNPYQDAGLSILMPNPIPLDAAGRIPQFFLADGYIKVRLVDKNGVTQLARDGILVIGPSAGGGGGGGVDPTTLIQTGMLAMFYGTGSVAGFVRANARTIGSATSGATERANADCQALFQFLWNADPNLAVSTGRGASAAADWAANKTIALPDLRGRIIAGLDDMGNVAANRLTVPFFGVDGKVLGNASGQESRTLSIGQLPSITSLNAGSIPLLVNPNGNNGLVVPAVAGVSAIFVLSSGNYGGGGQRPIEINFNAAVNNVTNFTGNIAASGVNVTSQNTFGQAHAIVQPTLLTTIYLKQ